METHGNRENGSEEGVMRTTSGAVGKCSPILRHYPKIRPKTVQCDGEAIEMESRKIEQPPEVGGHFGSAGHRMCGGGAEEIRFRVEPRTIFG